MLFDLGRDMAAEWCPDPVVLLGASVATLDAKAISPIQPKIGVLMGRAKELHSLVLDSIFTRISRGERVGLIVGDNLLDEYALAREVRRHGYDPSLLLAFIEFSRSFTCHQMNHAILNLDPIKIKEWGALYLQGLLETFFDEGIRYSEAERLLNESLIRLKQIAANGLPVIITVSPPAQEVHRQSFIGQVLRTADVYWTPTPKTIEHFTYQQLALW
jgi:hypothetical protein